MAYFNPVDPKAVFPKLEEETLKFWKKNKIFEKSVNLRPENKQWTFLDGPPFVTGMPHYGTLLSSIPKDVFGRYWTMKGFRVRRVWGWDGHGLPVENKVENKLKIQRKKDIEETVGVEKFIKECLGYVKEVSAEWEWYVDHIGRWVDFKNAYKTWDLDYMESVMWVFKQMYEKGYIYKGNRVSLYCPHCETPISNFEVAMDNDYKEVTQKATTYKFKLKDEPNTYFLAWSTTPWNKIVTTALAVNPKLKYVKVKEKDEYYILAKSTLGILKDKKHKIVEEYMGKDLTGKEYVPLYDYFKIEKGKKAFVVIPGDFVTSDEGTGIVTIAPYGIEDLEVMEKENIQIVLHVNDDGHLKDDAGSWAGKYYLSVNKLVNEDLISRNLLYKDEAYTHTISYCWRCHTGLFYNPQNAWFVDIQKLKSKLLKNNEKVNWYPPHFKKGRFYKSIEAAPDWCVSRSRYWGSPVPVWECPCGENIVPGSLKELEELSGKKITNLHKPQIDEVTIKCKKCGKMAKRVPEVLDSWIEAGSASFAERHFPFEKNIKPEDFFPPDFIVEYTGQIRAWFYVLHVISTAIFDSNAYKNVVVTGVILGTDGRKMSKNYGNYPDPKEMLLKYGGDALRLYLMGSPVMNGEDILISEEQYKDQVRNIMLTLWNVFNFFTGYANLDGWKPSHPISYILHPTSVLDQWILIRLKQTVKSVTEGLEKYDSVSAITAVKNFIVNDLSLWYIRRSRERVGPAAESEKDKDAFYETTHQILVTVSKLLAPLAPFLSESIYKNLTKEESVHLADWPKASRGKPRDEELIKEMQKVREIVEKAHAERKMKGIAVRQPLNKLSIINYQLSNKELEQLILDELNIKNIEYIKGKGELKVVLDTVITPRLKEEAKLRDLARKIQEERKKLGLRLTQKINLSNEWIPGNDKDRRWLIKKTQIHNISKGNFKVTNV
ncbi:MAG: isoleucine--tRNA ligase [bacterium]|nr:isoleucine--tRNA ligase [bacterium]